jgi:hypothetical protein
LKQSPVIPKENGFEILLHFEKLPDYPGVRYRVAAEVVVEGDAFLSTV